MLARVTFAANISIYDCVTAMLLHSPEGLHMFYLVVVFVGILENIHVLQLYRIIVVYFITGCPSGLNYFSGLGGGRVVVNVNAEGEGECRLGGHQGKIGVDLGVIRGREGGR